MRIPTFSRQTEADTAETERPTATGSATVTDAAPVRPHRDEPTTLTDLPPAPKPAARSDLPPAPPTATYRSEADRAVGVTTTEHDRVDHKPVVTEPVTTDPVVAGPKPRASLLATLGLILGVASALLVLSGPLLGYGIGVAGLALILSLLGIRATGKRHVAGKSDALIGMVLSLAAIVVGVLALTGSLSWLGTDMQPVTSLREWLDTQFANRF
ncbi:hypothetical protein ACWKSP_29735 [Micromonosporaceae bacterium Da 78-11]